MIASHFFWYSSWNFTIQCSFQFSLFYYSNYNVNNNFVHIRCLRLYLFLYFIHCDILFPINTHSICYTGTWGVHCSANRSKVVQHNSYNVHQQIFYRVAFIPKSILELVNDCKARLYRKRVATNRHPYKHFRDHNRWPNRVYIVSCKCIAQILHQMDQLAGLLVS